MKKFAVLAVTAALSASAFAAPADELEAQIVTIEAASAPTEAASAVEAPVEAASAEQNVDAAASAADNSTGAAE